MACLHCRRSERCNRSWMSLILTGMSEGWTSVKEPTQFNGLVTSLMLPLFTECESLLLLSEPDMILFRFPGFLTHAGLKGYWRPSNVLGAAVWPGNNLTKENAHTPSPSWLRHHLLTPAWPAWEVHSRFSAFSGNFWNESFQKLTLERPEKLLRFTNYINWIFPPKSAISLW